MSYLNAERLFPPWDQNNAGMPAFIISIKHSSGCPSSEFRQENDIKCMKVRKEYATESRRESKNWLELELIN